MSEINKLSTIPYSEFNERIERLRSALENEHYDLAIIHSTESDPANVRYLSDYWPVFEHTGVLLPTYGEPMLLIGPESEAYAKDRSVIPRIRKVLEYRESAEPEYPGHHVSSFSDLIGELGLQKAKRIALLGYSIMPYQIVEGFREALPAAEFEKADRLITSLRSIKSNNEIEMLAEAFRISEIAMSEVLKAIRPGMTERAVVGIAQKVMYDNGAEYEGMPQYILSGMNSRHAMSRPTDKLIERDDLVQINISARYAGYSSGVGRPVCMGKMTNKMRDLVEFGLEAHRKTFELMKPGVLASEVSKVYEEFVQKRGYGDNMLYGPCHGLGMMEVEPPWIELTSNYELTPGMTFQVDTFFSETDFGLRWENGVVITESGIRLLSKDKLEIMELG